MQDLNFNLCTGKVVRTTHYFEELEFEAKKKLLKALDTDKESRTERDIEQIEPYVRSFNFLKRYTDFTSDDFHPITKELKLVKIKRGERLTDFGTDCNEVFIIVSGRIVITHPND